jgi:hypothetical protein
VPVLSIPELDDRFEYFCIYSDGDFITPVLAFEVLETLNHPIITQGEGKFWILVVLG